jgi:hypothetical protein
VILDHILADPALKRKGMKDEILFIYKDFSQFDFFFIILLCKLVVCERKNDYLVKERKRKKEIQKREKVEKG